MKVKTVMKKEVIDIMLKRINEVTGKEYTKKQVMEGLFNVMKEDNFEYEDLNENEDLIFVEIHENPWYYPDVKDKISNAKKEGLEEVYIDVFQKLEDVKRMFNIPQALDFERNYLNGNSYNIDIAI